MERVGAVVHEQLILLSVELELATADAVAIASDECRKIGFRTVDDILDVVVSLDNVGHIAILVRNHDGYNGTTIICYSHFIA